MVIRMKLKRIVSLFLSAVVLVISLMCGTIEADAASANSGEELAAAKELGILPSEWEKNMSKASDFSGYYQMLTSFVSIKGKKYSSAWKKQIDVSKFPKRDMRRDDALVMLMLAGEAVGYNVYNARDYNGHGFYTETSADYGKMLSQLSYDYPYCNMEHEVSLYDQYGNCDDGKPFENAAIAGIFWMQRRMDLSQRKHFLDHDKKLNFNLDKVLTRRDAAASVVRLYNSGQKDFDPTFNTRDPKGKQDKALLKTVEKKKQAILTNTKALSCKGTAYYVSESGNDKNDGKTEKTAWKTLDKVNSATLSQGDGVYFERGGLWRGQLWAKPGVTYSAYGKGDKPKIYASPENGADPSKWKLLSGTKNIWVYSKPMMDCGCIVFNDGESWGKKVTPYYKDGFRSTKDSSKSFKVKSELTEDLAFFSKADSILYDGAPFRYTVMDNCDYNETPEVTGKLYLRCDKGNPGEVFKSIEFMVRQNIIIPAKNTKFNNLCLKYTGSHGIFMWGEPFDVSFCEIGWIGGSIQYYDYSSGRPVQLGNAVECDGNYDHFSVTDCYIYQCYDAGVSNQIPMENSDVTGGKTADSVSQIQKNVSYLRNVFEYNDMPVEIFIQTDDYDHFRMENVTVSENYFMYTGYGWGSLQGKKSQYSASVKGHRYPNPSKNFKITNNVFYLSTGALIETGANKEWLPVLSGNVYIQNEDGIFVYWTSDDGSVQAFSFDKNAGKIVKNVLKDKKGKVWST